MPAAVSEFTFADGSLLYHRAECTDIANAILEGADGICLTNTTAIGKYPLETVEMSRRQYKEAEQAINHRKKYQEMRDHGWEKHKGLIPSMLSSLMRYTQFKFTFLSL